MLNLSMIGTWPPEENPGCGFDRIAWLNEFDSDEFDLNAFFS